MFRPRSPLSFAVLAIPLLLAGCLFLPWVEAGAFEGYDYVNGIDIPVLGWTMLIVSLVTVAAVLVSALHGSPWFWVVSNFCAVFLTTLLGLALGLLDVVDSAVATWVVRALPEEIRDATPKLAASFGLWTMFLIALFATGVTAAASVDAARRRFESTEDDLGLPWPGAGSDVSSLFPVQTHTRLPWETPN